MKRERERTIRKESNTNRSSPVSPSQDLILFLQRCHSALHFCKPTFEGTHQPHRIRGSERVEGRVGSTDDLFLLVFACSFVFSSFYFFFFLSLLFSSALLLLFAPARPTASVELASHLQPLSLHRPFVETQSVRPTPLVPTHCK